MRISKPTVALLSIAAIAVALASASFSNAVPAGRELSPPSAAWEKGSQSDALDFNPFDDAAPLKYVPRESQARK